MRGGERSGNFDSDIMEGDKRDEGEAVKQTGESYSSTQAERQMFTGR